MSDKTEKLTQDIRDYIKSEIDHTRVGIMKRLLINAIAGATKRAGAGMEVPDEIDRNLEITARLSEFNGNLKAAYLRELLDVQKQYYPEDYDSGNERFLEEGFGL